MSQYPPQIPPQPLAYGAPPGAFSPAAVLAPARRAAILQWVIGGLMLLMGGCLGAVAMALPALRRQGEIEAELRKIEAEVRVPVGTALVSAAVLVIAAAIVYIVLGFFTRRGGIGAVITSIVVTSLVTLFLGLNTVSALFGPSAISGACLGAITIGAHVLLLMFLAQAAKSASSVRAMRTMYESQQWYWQQQQQQQQAGYGQYAPPGTVPGAPPTGWNYPTAGTPPPPPSDSK